MMQLLERRPYRDIKRELVQDFERRYLWHALEQHRFNLRAVERASGLSRRHITALIHKHGLAQRLQDAQNNSPIRLLP